MKFQGEIISHPIVWTYKFWIVLICSSLIIFKINSLNRMRVLRHICGSFIAVNMTLGVERLGR